MKEAAIPAVPFLADGVTVAQQILVLFVQVRILVGQRLLPACSRGRATRSAT
jgi:hypothetical protein